jgi:hypothetical protein
MTMSTVYITAAGPAKAKTLGLEIPSIADEVND